MIIFQTNFHSLGTVCIGTFGLRGSVTNDNAAAAIDAAGAIIFQLHKIGIKASIGELCCDCILPFCLSLCDFTNCPPGCYASVRFQLFFCPQPHVWNYGDIEQTHSFAIAIVKSLISKAHTHCFPLFIYLFYIGITSGKAYCGLVGSPLRHEYAVMGPSTNLSARLMGKAKPGMFIICFHSEFYLRLLPYSCVVYWEVHVFPICLILFLLIHHIAFLSFIFFSHRRGDV